MAAPPVVRVASLCSGIGALDLGVKLAVPGARTIVYVEREVQAIGVLASRFRDGRLDPGPVWSDLSTFDARRWRGAVDLVVAGFPCQPVSIAGRRRGQDDDRWLWPDVCRVIAETEAPVAFLENVTGLLTKGADEVLDELAAMGLDAEWGAYSAAQAGAPHLRDRWFALAYPRRGAPLWLEQIATREPDGKRNVGLNTAAAVKWPTPMVRDWKDGACADANVPTNAYLGRAAVRWPTPTATDSKASGAQGYSTSSGRHSGVTLTDAAIGPACSSNIHGRRFLGTPTHGRGGLVLNPLFVEVLMGLPVGWTSLEPIASVSSATA